MNDLPPLTLLPALARLGRLIRKELSEILRDRRTIFTLVLMPVLLYPLLSMAFQQFLLASVTTEPVTQYRVGVAQSQDFYALMSYLNVGRQQTLFQAVAATGLRTPGGPGPFGVAGMFRLSQPVARAGQRTSAQQAPPEFVPETIVNLEGAVQERAVQLAIRFRKSPRPPAPNTVAVDLQIFYLENDPNSVAALRHLERQLAQANKFYLQDQLWALGVRQRAVPVQANLTPLRNAEQTESVSLAALVPLILILMTITGAVYPAIDLTAGERERGTLEILVAAPVPRLALLFAKYVSVVTVALLTAVINLVMMLLTLQLGGMAGLIFGARGMTVEAIAPMFALLILFALFFSAVLLALASFARSFKEAQAYLIPLMLAALAPGVAGLLPELELTGLVTVVPLLNIVLLSRDLIKGTAELMVAGVVVFSTLLYAAAAIGIAARIFGAEAVLYSEQTAWADLFRRPRQASATAPVSSALLCLALIFPLTFVLTNLVARLGAEELNQRPWLAWQVGLVALVSVLLFGLLPLASARLGNVRLVTGFRLRLPPWPALVGGLLLGVALWPLVIEFQALMQQWGATNLNNARSELVLEKLRQVRATFPAALMVAAFVLPALAEEWFFRGFLFAALRSGAGPRTTIVVSALLFGVFHLIVTDAFALERFLPSTALGLVLGWVAYRSGSVLPSMLLHACHNGLLVLVSYSELARQEHLPLPWLLGAAVLVASGFGLLFLCRPPLTD